MTLARRLLAVSKGGGAFTASGIVRTLTAAPNGGWTQIPEARALVSGGRLYFAYVDGTSGDVEVCYADAGGTNVGTPIALHGSALDSPADTHDCPGLLVMDDGKLLAVYSAHDGTTIWGRISTNTLASDPTLSGGFATEFTVKGSGVYTYPFVMQRMSETGSPIYVWYRYASGGVNRLRYSKSTDHGANWTHSGDIWADGAGYWKISTDSLWRIDFFCTEGNPSNPTSRIFHFYADDTAYHASDGTAIADPPHNSGTGPTLVYDSSDGPGWPTDAYLDGSTPMTVYNVDDGAGTDSSFVFAKWNGSTWAKGTVLGSVGAGIVDPAPVAAIDSGDPARIYLVRLVSGVFELWRFTTADGGATWTGAAITSGSSDPNLYPANVHDHAAGQVRVVWLYGSYTGAETAFDLGIKGMT